MAFAKHQDMTAAAERVLAFRVKEQFFGLPINRVKEIIDYKKVTRVPLVPDFIKGIYNLRGNVLPVIDVGRRFGWEPIEITRLSCIVIAEVESDGKILDIGLAVDAVQEVIGFQAADLDGPPNFGTGIRSDFIARVGKVNGRFILILNMDQVLNIEEISKLREIAESGQP